MAYNEKLADRIREALVDVPKATEKNMFGGVCFLVNSKMCIGVVKDEMMCRINPDRQEEALERNGCRIMDFTGRPMKGYIFVSDEGMKSKKDFMYWVDLCLDFNKLAKASKKKSSVKKPAKKKA
jgi:TfoX/Sxy family transcriptional regulator of competence genes